MIRVLMCSGRSSLTRAPQAMGSHANYLHCASKYAKQITRAARGPDLARRTGLSGGIVQREPPGAGADRFHFGAGEIGKREQQVCRGLFRLSDDVAVALQLAVRSADEQRGRAVAIMRVAVAHAAAEIEHH